MLCLFCLQSLVTRAAGLSAIWANDGGDKVVRSDVRASHGNVVTNRIWDGSKVRLFGARNEVLGFALILESASNAASNVTVSFNRLNGPGGAKIQSAPATGAGLFVWTNRNIELFYVRYLEIKGLSRISYETYDERHIPERFRRPYDEFGIGSGDWTNRPDHNKFYPDIAVPLELVPSFNVSSGQSQVVWCDIYLPRGATAGLYTGAVTVVVNQQYTSTVPVSLRVLDFALPDVPSARTMVVLGFSDVNLRYVGEEYPDGDSANGRSAAQVRQRHFQLAHRHKLSLIDSNEDSDSWPYDRPRPYWEPVLNGALFSATNGYDGPGLDTGNNVFSIGTYSSWDWKGEGQAGMWAHTDGWASWFASNAPGTTLFLYLIDESDDYPTQETWAAWINANPGRGTNVMSMATIQLPDATNAPSLDVVASWASIGISNQWELASRRYLTNAQRRFFLYNGQRPAVGSFATEDDGVALREQAWAQFKKRIDRWFFWESTYYNNFQGGMGQTRVFQSAFTFGSIGDTNELGETGWNYSNGDGVLFYPGTDQVYPADSYNCPGPFASLRMKLWRRGIQDVDYLALASQFDATQVNALVQTMVPKALWEYGVSDPDDPTWVRTDISWSTDPDRWESAREKLAGIIETGLSNFQTRPLVSPTSAVALAWNRLGPDFLFDVQYLDNMATSAWINATGTWPSAQTNWTETALNLPAARFYRIRATLPPSPR